MKRILKKAMAFWITLCMAVAMILPGSGMTAYAVTGELQNENLPATGHNDTSMWAWGDKINTNLYGIGFDIHGITKAGESEYKNDSNGQKQMWISYKDSGFQTYISQGIETKEIDKNKVHYGVANGYYPEHLPEKIPSTVAADNGNAADVTVNGKTLELKMKISSTPDDRYVLVDYYVYNPSSSAVDDIWLGTCADLMVGDHDSAIMRKIPESSPKLVRGIDNGQGNGDQGEPGAFSGNPYPYFRSTFDLIIGDDERLGTTAAESWLGQFGQQMQNVFSTGDAYPENGGDSAMAWHWKFDMGPHAIVHKRVAFYPQAMAFYVNNLDTTTDEQGKTQNVGKDISIDMKMAGSVKANHEIQNTDGATGAARAKGLYLTPFRTIDNAVQRIGIAPAGSQKGTINIQTDEAISKTIEIPAGSDVTILTSDLDQDGNLIDHSVQKTIKRAPGFTGSIFHVAEGATLTLNNVTIDGTGTSSQSPLIDVEGKVSLEGDSHIINGNTSESLTMPSAVYVHGNGVLTLRNVTVKDNQSKPGGKGSIYLAADDGSKKGSITLRDKVTVSGNTAGGKPSNLVLGKDKMLTLYNSTAANTPSGFTGSVGVSTESKIDPKTADSPGDPAVITNDNGVTPANYMGNFTSDKAEGNVTLTTKGTNIALEATALKLRVGSSLNPEQGKPIPPNFAAAADQDIVAGAVVTPVTAPALTPEQAAGKTLVGVDINPSGAGLVAGSEADNYKVTGTMPTQATTITFLYTQKQGSISFNPSGGSPQPNAITGAIGDYVSGTFPGVTRYGYKSDCQWYNNVNFSGDPEHNLPSTFPENPLTLYAKWVVNEGVLFNFAINHELESGKTTVPLAPQTSQHYAEFGVNADPVAIPGYSYSSGSVIPETSYYTATNPAKGEEAHVGTFNATGHFTGRMANADTTVTYKYKVNPDIKRHLTVKHMVDGRTIKTDTHDYPAEASITAAPDASLYGYEYLNYEKGTGFTSDPVKHTYGALGSFGNGDVFTGFMPNQDVEITYNYKSTGVGYTYAVKYTRGGKTIPYNEPKSMNIPADTPLDGSNPESYRNIYGYTLTGNPSDDPHIAGNSFNSSTHIYTGLMPNQDLTLDYKYDRDPNLWGNVTFKAVGNGHLEMPDGANPDLTQSSGAFQAQVLLDNNDPAAHDSQGHSGAYTWQKLEDQKLVPSYKADDTYRFAKWVLDVNHNGTYEPNVDTEEVAPETTTFKKADANRTVFAVFEKDPQYWTKIQFEAQNGTINAGQPLFCDVLKTKHWSDLLSGTDRPDEHQIVNKTNYIWDGWYVNGTPVKDSDQIKEGATYIATFKPDPDVFGTGLIAPEASGTLEVDGSGVVKVDYAKDGYQYVVTDVDGKIVGIKPGHNGGLDFPGQTPGTHYYAYEASAAFQGKVGDSLDTAAVSGKTDVLTPVVENNYSVSQDAKDDDKAQLAINPADRKAEYAILDADGNQVIHGWTIPGGSDPTVVFDNLDPGVDYVVVARPRGSSGISELSKYPDGTAIKANILEEVDIPKFIVQTENGKVVQVNGDETDTGYYADAKAGDTIKIHAEDSNGTGRFQYWDILVGDIPDMPVKVRKPDYTFKMPKVNVVLAAHYSKVASDSNATVIDDVRGGSRHEMAADPDELSDLAGILTTDADRRLKDVNKANVTYKIVFDKNKATAEEKAQIKGDTGAPYKDHPNAFGTAWGVDVKLERYVNNRLIKPASPSNASPSNATVKAYVQLDNKSADMLDYKLYEVNKDSGMVNLPAIPWESDNPTDTGGLFSFQATTGKRYVLALSKAYRVSVSDTLKKSVWYESDEDTPTAGYNFRVRKGDELDEDNNTQEEQWSSVKDYEDQHLTGTNFLDYNGVLHTYQGWSTRNMPKDFARIVGEDQIFKRTHIYSWFSNNRREVLAKRKELDNTLLDARELAKNYYLTKAEAQELLDVILWSQEDYDRQKGQPYHNYDPTGGEDMEDGLRKSDVEELQAAIDRLKVAMETAQAAVDKAKNIDNQISSSGGGGGGSAGAGKGSGTVRDPYVSAPDRSYRVGVNGNWEKKEDGRWSFALNGGIPLQSMWAWLSYDADGKEKTGWYHFNSRGLMDDGWFKDENQNWYYCNTEKDGFQGMMKYGWYSDPIDQHKYYLDPTTGMMKVGWQMINGKWYYFTEHNAQATYTYDPVTESWSYNGAADKPYGSMWINDTTPDGYKVGADGAWIK